MLEELISRTEFKVETSYTPFEGTDDNPVKLSPAIVLRFFCKPTKRGCYPTYEDAVKFIMLCKARRLDPREGDAFLVGYDTKDGPQFNLITAHQAFLKRAESHKAFDGMQSGIIVKHTETDEEREIEGDLIPEDCAVIGGWSRVYRTDRNHQVYRRIDLRQYDKGFSLWGTITGKAMMICKCAEADGLRSAFPNSLSGMYLREERGPEDAAQTNDAQPAPSEAVRRARKEKNTGEKVAAGSPVNGAGSSPETTTTTTNPSTHTNAGAGNPTPAPASPTPAPGRPKHQYCKTCKSLMVQGVCPSCGPAGAAADVHVTTQTVGTGLGEASRESTSVPDPSAPPPTAEDEAPEVIEKPKEKKAKPEPAKEPTREQRAEARNKAAETVGDWEEDQVKAFITEFGGSDDPVKRACWAKGKLLAKFEGSSADAIKQLLHRKVAVCVEYFRLLDGLVKS